jgi:phosphoribosylformylglycinamidine synthase
VTEGGAAEGLFKMALGNRLGFVVADDIDADLLFQTPAGSIVAEVTQPVPDTYLLGQVTSAPEISCGNVKIGIEELESLWDSSLESVFPTRAENRGSAERVSFKTRPAFTATSKFAKPRAVITAFPGTNCELDTARAVINAGGMPEIKVVKNLTPSLLEESVSAVEAAIRESQIIIIPGGFSGGDEPDGSAKFITAFFRNPRITDAVHELLLRRGGLMLGICNGFQALVKLGLVPFGEIRPMDADCPTLTFNLIGRHQAKYVYTRIASVNSPWMNLCHVDDVFAIPVSHGEGRFVASDLMLQSMRKGGQIATQYCSPAGEVSQDILVNPNGSVMAIEGITSPDGRVMGKMCHTERRGAYVAKNIYGEKHQPIFESGIKYFL